MTRSTRAVYSFKANLSGGQQLKRQVAKLGRIRSAAVLLRDKRVGPFLKAQAITYRATKRHVTEFNNPDFTEHVTSRVAACLPRHQEILKTLVALAHNLKLKEEAIDKVLRKLEVEKMVVEGFGAMEVKALMLEYVDKHSAFESAFNDVFLRKNVSSLGVRKAANLALLLKKMMSLDRRSFNNYASVCQVGAAYLS